MFNPAGVAIDESGNLYIADQSNRRIRRVAPSGTIDAVAGSSQRYADLPAAKGRLDVPRGISLDASDNLYIAEEVNRRVSKILPNGTMGVVAGVDTSNKIEFSGAGLKAENR